MIQSIVHRWPLLSPIFWRSVRIPRRKNWSSFEAIHESNFLLLHKIGSAGQPGHVLLIQTSDSQRKQRLENTAGGIGLPILTFPSMS